MKFFESLSSKLETAVKVGLFVMAVVKTLEFFAEEVKKIQTAKGEIKEVEQKINAENE